MSTKVNKQLQHRNRHKVDKVINFPFASGQPDTSHLDPKLKLSDHDSYLIKIIAEKLEGSRNAAEVHIQAMNLHQKAMHDQLLSAAEKLGINFTFDANTTEYAFNIDSMTFISKSVPRSKGGLGAEPEPPKTEPAKPTSKPVK